MRDKIYCHRRSDAPGTIWLNTSAEFEDCECVWSLHVSDPKRCLAAVRKKLSNRHQRGAFLCSPNHARKIAIEHAADRAPVLRYRTQETDERLLLRVLIGAFLMMLLALQILSAGTVQMLITIGSVLIAIVALISTWRARRSSFGR